MGYYRCRKSGDHVFRAAVRRGFRDWKTVWDANSKLKKKRANPLLVFTGDKTHPGDLLTIPKKDRSSEKQSIDKHGTYQVPLKKLCLRLRILRGDFSPIADAPFELKIEGGKEHKGKTDGKGCIKVKGEKDGPDPFVPPKGLKATLHVTVKRKDAEDKKDKDKGKKNGDGSVASDIKYTWNLQIGKLNPLQEEAPNKKCVSGVQQRLNNLGIFSGPVDGSCGLNTKAAIERFQSMFELTIDGDPAQKAMQGKLQSVHDTNADVPAPKGKKPVKTNVPRAKFIKTKPEDIGHVFPQFIGSQEKLLNTLIIPPEFRIKLELGKIEDLFLKSVKDDFGKMERLQVAGLFYFPLHHKKAKDAGKAAWKYYKDKLGGSEDKLKTKIQEFVVDKGKLPPPAADPKKPKDENFVKLRMPGGYTYIGEDKRFRPNYDPKYKMPMETEGVYMAQRLCLRDNPVLGAIPLKAFVEKRYGGSGKWMPAPDVAVHFKLVKPYDLPEFKNTDTPGVHLNRPPLRESDMQTGTATGVGPKKHVEDALKHNYDPKSTDPQVNNCHLRYGGKRKLAVAKNIFELGVNLASHTKKSSGKKVDRPGFHKEHTDANRKKEVPGPFLKPPEKSPHKHAVRAKTNAEGYAGVIFTPSPAGGDRYRIQAYVGPDTKESDGTDKDAVSVETGTMVMWRNVRVSRVLKMPHDNLADEMKNNFLKEFDEVFGVTGTGSLKTNPLKWLRFSNGVEKKDGTAAGFCAVDTTPKSDPNSDYVGFAKQMARSFCEVEFETDAKTPKTITNDDWYGAIAAAKTNAKANNTYNFDIDKLILEDKTKITVTNSFVFIPMRLPNLYNKAVGAGSPKRMLMKPDKKAFKANRKSKYDSWFDDAVLLPFVSHLVGAGYLPGLTIVQVSTISSLHAWGFLSDYSIGLGMKTCVCLSGKDSYPTKPRQNAAGAQKRDGTTTKKDTHGYAALCSHEWGHNLFREHAPPDPAPTAVKIHDKKEHGYCVMTYLAMEGDFCGHCVLALAGWKRIKLLP